jgi:pimeloyl-ACP methyl ester carboxylesterase
MQKVKISARDGVEVAGLWWDKGGSRSALLLHMMPATKESWIPLAEQLFAKGLNVLAIDFRGHGESGGGDYKSFANQEHQKYILDAESGLGFLREHYPDCEVVLAGASIGANIALQAMVNDNSLHQSVALSAGLDYYGVKAEDFVGKLSREQQVLFVGSLDDLRGGGMDCGYMAENLYTHATCQKEKLIFETGGHGTDLLTTHPELADKVLDFLIH